jgi:hypothetical protein
MTDFQIIVLVFVLVFVLGALAAILFKPGAGR